MAAKGFSTRLGFTGVGSKSLHHLMNVLHLRRRSETVAHEPTPFGEIRRAAEIHGVILHRLPLDKQPVARWPLDRTLQRQTGTPLGAPEHRRGLRYTGLELRFHAGFHVDLGDLENHRLSFRCVRQDAVGATLVVALLPANTGAQPGRPQGSPLQRAMSEDAPCARPSNVMTWVDASIPID